MSLTISESGGGNAFPIISEGTHPAVCYMLADLGMQENKNYGTTSRKVLIGWEITDEQIELNGDLKPRTFSKQYTASLNEKSTLRKDLIAWRGRDFTDQELAAFDLRSIVGVPCFIQIVHTTKGEKTYANLSSIMSVPKGLPKPSKTLPVVVYDIDSSDPDDIDNLPEWIAKIIEQSPSYKERLKAIEAEANGAQQAKFTELEDDGDLPF